MQRRLSPRKWVSGGVPTLPCIHERAAAVNLRLDPFFSREAAFQVGGSFLYASALGWAAM